MGNSFATRFTCAHITIFARIYTCMLFLFKGKDYFNELTSPAACIQGWLLFEVWHLFGKYGIYLYVLYVSVYAGMFRGALGDLCVYMCMILF